MNSWGVHNQTQDVWAGNQTFPVYAMADGTVLWSAYSASSGNVVVIEHTMPSGKKFRSIYHHLRNGRDNDIALAQATEDYCQGRNCELNTCLFENGSLNRDSSCNLSNCQFKDEDGNIDKDRCDNWLKYQRAADQAAQILQSDPDNPDVEATWGTNSQTLRVSQGDAVVAGQQIGWGGDTGADSGSVHLHWWTVRKAVHMVNGSQVSRWTNFDATGLYTDNIECYERAYPTGADYGGTGQHASIMAPFHRFFAGVSGTLFQKGFEYYSELGIFPYSLGSDYQSGIGRSLAGEFRVRNSIPVRHYRTFDLQQSDFEHWWDQGWVPAQMTVEGRGGTPLYSTIYKQRTTGFWGSHKMTPSWFQTRNDELQSQGYALIDLAPYVEDDQLYFSAHWEQSSASAVPAYGLTKSELDDFINYFAAYGFRLVRLHRYQHPGEGTRYAGLWRSNFPKNTAYLEFSSRTEFQDALMWYEVFQYRPLHISAHKGKYTVVFQW